MGMEQKLVDYLFSRLALRYGEAFLRQWPDTDIAAVKADWADVLDGVRPQSLGYAMRYLPADRPPNAMQLRDICRRAPPPDAPMLPSPAPNDPAVAAAAMKRMQATRAYLLNTSPAQRCIDNIEARAARNGGRLSHAQSAMLRSCLRMPGCTSRLMAEVGGGDEH